MVRGRPATYPQRPPGVVRVQWRTGIAGPASVTPGWGTQGYGWHGVGVGTGGGLPLSLVPVGATARPGPSRSSRWPVPAPVMAPARQTPVPRHPPGRHPLPVHWDTEDTGNLSLLELDLMGKQL